MTGSQPFLPLFVYGTLMYGQSAFELLAAQVERIAQATATGLTLHNVGRYPIALPGEGVIRGEVHWLRRLDYAELLARLDEYEGAAYQRQIWTTQLTQSEATQRAWIYVGAAQKRTRYPQIHSGDWRVWLAEKR